MLLSKLRIFIIVAGLFSAIPALAQPFGTWLLKGPAAAPHSYVEIPASAAFDFTSGFTVEAWVSGTDDGDCSGIAGKGYKQGWWVGVCGTTLRSYIKGISSVRDGGTVSSGWTHIAVTYDGTSRKHYIDGELVLTNAETGPMGVTTSPLRINSDANWAFSFGSIDEVRLWNVARSQADIRAAMNTTIDAARPGLVAVYHLDGNADDALAGHNGTSQGVFSAPPFEAWLVRGTGAAAHSYVEIPANAAFDFTTGFTFEAWVLGSGNSGCSSIAGKNFSQAWWVGICGTKLRSYIKGTASVLDGGTVTSGWTHVAVTYDGTNRKHYVNGALVLTNAETGPMGLSAAAVRINSDVNYEYSFGAVDEVRLWNVARTQAEIRSTMNATIDSPRAGLVAVYHLDGTPNDAVGGRNGKNHGIYFTAAPRVIEFYNTALDNYFVTANINEAAVVDDGGAGPGWSRTGNTFRSGGSTSVCRFYGSLSPGPNSHFYTVDTLECQALKDQQIPAGDPRRLTVKSWNFESLDFDSTPSALQACPFGTVPVYRAYNNGFTRAVDSNHRITSNPAAIQDVVARGWRDEGVVMCAPK